MSYDERTGKLDWRDESSWAAISFCCGLVLTLIYLFYGRVAGRSGVAVVLITGLGFYVLSILARIQNHRGRFLTGKTAVPEHVLKYVSPVLGFLIGLALLLFGCLRSVVTPTPWCRMRRRRHHRSARLLRITAGRAAGTVAGPSVGAGVALLSGMGFVRISAAVLVAAVWLAANCGYAGHIAEVPAVLGEVLAGSPPVPASVAVWMDVREFYRRRENVPAWVTGDQTRRARGALEVLRMAQAHGLRAADYGEQQLLRLLDSRSTRDPSDRDAASRARQTADLDIQITVSLFSLGRDVSLGGTTPETGGDGRSKARRKAPDFVGTLAGAGSDLPRWLDTVRPQHPQYVALQKALADVREQQEAEASSDASVEGLIATLALNLERWRWMPDDLGPRYVLVNIPAYRLTAHEYGAAVLDMRVVVGKPKSKTPVFSGDIATLVFSPYWNIPNSIFLGEMAPQAARDPMFLGRNNLEVLRLSTSGPTAVDPSTIDWNDRAELRQLALRQRPGRNNALGLVKFLFPNEFAVYLHDTPAKKLFAKAGRALSHGCVRIEHPQALAQWALQDDQEWDERRVLAAMHAGIEKHVRLARDFPVHIVYFTAWVDAVGVLRVEPDVYGYDSAL